VHHTLPVSIVQRVGDGRGQLGRLARRRTSRPEQVRESHAFDKLADQIRQAIRFANLIDRHDARMPELRDAARFAQKAIAVMSITELSGARHLQRHHPPQRRVTGLIHRPEPAHAHDTEQIEIAE
jgi:hypothetical protein